MEIALFLQGLLLMASLIIGMGPQNLHVFRCACSGEATVRVVVICLIGDIAIMLAGVLLFSSVGEPSPAMQEVLHVSTIVLLCVYGLQALKRARTPKILNPATGEVENRVVILALALTFLNPAVYIDSFFLIGMQANQAGTILRWYFLVGAMLCSLCWYPGLALSGVLFSKKCSKGGAASIDYGIAILLFGSALLLYL